ncbi:carbonic anhydrase [Micromonospora sp. NBC_01796]|uniref:carbonic anhydrase n=1 Tax=Micromonospora sp. NBC_01796 TaxID=2975987 RepID=UPI002DD7C367|nr:carbonic anhydrase [Micromonospora sp. NBC_01796]WSA84654.1 carbonic anhydrase [Micromonospora sp. NBC_01796]
MSSQTVSRRSVLAAGGLTAAGVAGVLGLATPASAHPTEPPAPTPTTALNRLIAGNKRFYKGEARHPHQSLKDLHELASGQHPFAITLGCADSRVSPEILFDQGLGDLFDNRVAGNIVDDLLLGSIEFAIEEFGVPLIVVVGHERCGAISATVDAIENGGEAPGHIGTIVEALRPVVEPLVGGPGDVVEAAVKANVLAQVQALFDQSEIVREKVHEGALGVVGARYDLDNGKVTLLG